MLIVFEGRKLGESPALSRAIAEPVEDNQLLTQAARSGGELSPAADQLPLA